MKEMKHTVKLINSLLESLARLRMEHCQRLNARFTEFTSRCEAISQNSRLYALALGKHWPAAAGRIRKRAARNLHDFNYHFQQFRDLMETDFTPLPSASDILAELDQVVEEYASYEFDSSRGSLSVVTDPIVLDEVHLGPFEIRLILHEIPYLLGDSPYRIIALEPNPAGSDEGITHPHVSAQRLCEGDGHAAINKALEQGRFCDFFNLVTGILKTYNPNSPYVALSDWDGYSCHDCGYTVSRDESYYCECCDYDYCSQCSTYCQRCDVTICLGCAYECPSCLDAVCRDCTAVCRDCGRRICKGCLNENLCEDCQEKRKEQDDEEQTQEPTPSSIQSHGVGQAGLPAGSLTE